MKVNKNKKVFTLIELIVVISIIAILSAISFLYLQEWLIKSRDGRRLVDLENMVKSLTVDDLDSSSRLYAGDFLLPLPDDYKEVKYSGEILFYQGKFGPNVVKVINSINEPPKDPKYGNYYTYSIDYSRKKFQVAVFLENVPEAVYFSKSYTLDASAYVNRLPKSAGNKVGILLNNMMVPIEEDWVSSKDLKGSTDVYNLLYPEELNQNVLGDNIIVYYLNSCADLLNKNPLLKGRNGLYNIYVSSGSSVQQIQVYCIMTKNPITLYYINSGKTTSKLSDDNSCKDIGMKIWSPETKEELLIGINYVADILAKDVYNFTDLKEVISKLGPLGIYKPTNGGNYGYRGLNSETQPDRKSIRGSRWFVSSYTRSKEPSGDYIAYCRLGAFSNDWRFRNAEGRSYTYDDIKRYGLVGWNDWDCNYSYTAYVCFKQ